MYKWKGGLYKIVQCSGFEIRCVWIARLSGIEEAYISRGVWLFAMYFFKHLLELGLQLLVLGALVELAHKVATSAESIAGELQCSETQVLCIVTTLR